MSDTSDGNQTREPPGSDEEPCSLLTRTQLRLAVVVAFALIFIAVLVTSLIAEWAHGRVISWVRIAANAALAGGAAAALAFVALVKYEKLRRERAAIPAEIERASVRMRMDVEKLRELETVVRSSPAVVFVRSPEDNWPVRFITRNVEQFGYTPEEFATGSLGYADIVHEEDKARLRFDMSQAPDECTTQYRILTRSGETRWVEDRTRTMRDPDGEIAYRQGTITDITARKRAEEELARSNAELEQFAYVASHDLREPLRMVKSYVELLARRYRGKLDSDADEFINFAVDGASRMEAMITGLLEYSRVDTRPEPLESTDCEAVLDEVVNSLKALIDESGAQVTHDPLPTVMADRSQLSRLFQNLIANSIKFRGEEPPRVHISAQQREGDWLFTVRDNGIGIATDDVERVFRMFERTHTMKYPGDGIGLAVCHKVVERHGGRMWVESKLGEGSIFYFTIPTERGE